MERPLSFIWNRSRATALAVTLLLHGVAAIWLLSVRVGAPVPLSVRSDLVWLPMPEPLQPQPRSEPPEPAPIVVPAPVPLPAVALEPEDEPESNAITLPDWEGEARAVARQFAASKPAPRRFGPEPAGEPPVLRSARPPHSVFERPLPRVGTAVRMPDGEQILWVSDNCYLSLDSQSLTMREHHALKRGITSCQVGVGKRQARGDLFDPIKRKREVGPIPGDQQEPGCGPGVGEPPCAP